MIKHNQDGAVNGLLVSLVLAVVLLVGAMAFGGWSYTQMQDYKNNSDAKSKVAAEEARKQESAKKDLQFVEEAKNPFRLYSGPDAYGSLRISYPKTWSGYVDDSGTANSGLVDGYFGPGEVPSATNKNSVFALRAQVVNEPYAEVIEDFDRQVKEGVMTVSAYALPKVPKTVGVMATGKLTDEKTVTMVVLPLRSQTIKIWTEGSQYVDDFNKNILPNFSFSP